MIKYKIITKDEQSILIEADGFDVNVDEGVAILYVGPVKAYFDLNSIMSVYTI